MLSNLRAEEAALELSGPLAAGTHSIALTSLSGTVELDAFLILR